MAVVNVYELVKLVLDETYAEIEGTEPERDAAITAALAKLTESYNRLTVAPGPDYSSAPARFAYIFCYVTSHANLVGTMMACKPICDLFKREQDLVVSCIGGGPGSDVVGIIKQMMATLEGGETKPPRILAYICDREKRWMDSWGDVGLKLPATLSLSTAYAEIDVTDPQSWDMKKYLKADVFTLSYFLSEVYTLREKATPFFETLFAKAKPGAAFAFVDNNDDTFLGWFDEMAAKAGLQLVHEYRGQRWMPSTEQQSVLQNYITRFARQTKLNAFVGERIVLKPLH